jgi:hypothetical protein
MNHLAQQSQDPHENLVSVCRAARDKNEAALLELQNWIVRIHVYYYSSAKEKI